MNNAKILAAVCLVAMTIALGYGFSSGDLGAEGNQLLQMPWGIVSLVDVFAGFALFSGWVVYRVQSLARSLLWIAAIIVLGNFTASLYALIALISSKGDWRRFWMGRRAHQSGVPS